MSDYDSFTEFEEDMRHAAEHIERAHSSIESSSNPFAKKLTAKKPSEVKPIVDFARRVFEKAEKLKERMKRMLEIAAENEAMAEREQREKKQ